jgi:hypothetical protein
MALALRGTRYPPWYPSAKIFRRPLGGHWSTVVDDVIRALDSQMSTHNPCFPGPKMTMGDRSPPLLSLAIIADRLQYAGSDRERSVRRLFARHHVPLKLRGRIYFATEDLYHALLEAMTTCPSPSESAASISTRVARSVSGGKRESSKSILAAQIDATLRKSTARNSKRISATKSFTVVEGGRRI